VRYAQLNAIIDQVKPTVILEVGTWDGNRAIQMANCAFKHNNKVTYIGYDYFEDITDEIDEKELNVKRHVSYSDVYGILWQFKKEAAEDNKEFTFFLRKGDSKLTLKHDSEIGWARDNCKIGIPNFAFVDGGHSIETIESDLKSVKSIPVVVVDDYYTHDHEMKRPDITKFGCNLFIDGQAEWTLLPAKDPVRDGGFVQMAISGWKPVFNLLIKTKNCVPEEEIRENVKYALSTGLPFIKECARHETSAIMCAAGPSLESHLDEIRNSVGKIVTVKRAHDRLIDCGVVPWACILLDPRPHVQEFIQNPHPGVLYLVATMVHPTTLDQLRKHNANIYLYNALVNAGEKELIKTGFLIGGGSSSSTRGVRVLHALGFRHFICYGYDSCIYHEPDWSEKIYDGRPKWIKVEVNGKQFISTAELIAQCQDFEKMLAEASSDFDVRGEGMIAHVFRTLRPKSDFNTLFIATNDNSEKQLRQCS